MSNKKTEHKKLVYQVFFVKQAKKKRAADNSHKKESEWSE